MKNCTDIVGLLLLQVTYRAGLLHETLNYDYAGNNSRRELFHMKRKINTISMINIFLNNYF